MSWRVLVLGWLLGCSPSASDLQTQATSALSSMQYDKALELCEQALALEEAQADPLRSWQLQQVRLEAMARKGQGAQVKSALEPDLSIFLIILEGIAYFRAQNWVPRWKFKNP